MTLRVEANPLTPRYFFFERSEDCFLACIPGFRALRPTFSFAPSTLTPLSVSLEEFCAELCK